MTGLPDLEALGWSVLSVAGGRAGMGVLWRPVRRLGGWFWPPGFEDRVAATVMLRMAMMAAVWPLPTQTVRELVGTGSWVVLYGDDVLAGDDGDQWRRRWRAARNAVRWRMALPGAAAR